MAVRKRRTWKFWVSRTLLILLLLGVVWLVNLIWFRPFNIGHFYDRAFVRLALRSPETVTSLGVPVLYDWNKDKWDDVSDAQGWKDFEFMKQEYATLTSYDFDKQTPANQLNTKILRSYLETILAAEPFAYHGYSLDQLSGVHSDMPDLLKNKHRLNTESDAKAYIARLEGFGPKFDQVLERLAIKEGKGIIPPRFVIQHVIAEMKGFVDPGVEANMLYSHFVEKVGTIEKLSEDEKAAYSGQVAERIGSHVFPAYQKMIAYHESLHGKATTDDGAWKLPDGDAYYRYMLKASTTTDLDPEDVYRIGLDEVERIGREMRAILLAEGFTDTTKPIGAIMLELGQEARFQYPESDTGKLELAAAYKQIVDEAGFRKTSSIPRKQSILKTNRKSA